MFWSLCCVKIVAMLPNQDRKYYLNKAFRWLIVYLVTLIVCVVGAAPLFATSLFVSEVISYPLTLLMMGLLAALTSSWMSNLLNTNSTYSRLLCIVVSTEIIASLLIILRIRFSPNIVSLIIWGIVVSVAACLAAWKFRAPRYSRGIDIILSLALLVFALAIVVVVIAVASRFGLTGA